MLAGFLALLLVAQGAGGSPKELRKEPASILLVIADDVAVDDLVGLPLPNLARLAANGLVFPNAYANPTCSPSRRSLFFSQWFFEESGEVCVDNPSGSEPPVAQVSMMDLAREAGLRTGLIGKWHVGGNPSGGPWVEAPLVHGFDRWRGTPANVSSCGGQDYANWLYTDGVTSRIETVYNTAVERDELLAFLGATRGPKLAVWAPALAHGPFHRPPAEFLPPGWPATSDPRTRFESMVVSLDLVLGEILERVDLATTTVIFVGDNGTPEQVAPEPLRAKGSTFERGIHVPLVIAGPGIRQGTDKRLVHLVDLLPTVADLVGLPAPTGIDGLSLFRPDERDYVVCGSRNQQRGTFDQCVRSERFKLRRFQLRLGTQPREEFYDLGLDPDERIPIRTDDPTYRAIAAKHSAWLDQAF